MERHPYKVDKSVFKTKAEKCALEIIEWMMSHNLWIDTCIYVNGKRYSDYGDDGHYHYDNTWDCVFCEDNMNPKNYFDWAGDFLSMSFEGDFYDIINYNLSINYCDSYMKEFDAILKKYGKYYELGNAWNLSLYDC